MVGRRAGITEGRRVEKSVGNSVGNRLGQRAE